MPPKSPQAANDGTSVSFHNSIGDNQIVWPIIDDLEPPQLTEDPEEEPERDPRVIELDGCLADASFVLKVAGGYRRVPVFNIEGGFPEVDAYLDAYGHDGVTYVTDLVLKGGTGLSPTEVGGPESGTGPLLPFNSPIRPLVYFPPVNPRYSYQAGFSGFYPLTATHTLRVNNIPGRTSNALMRITPAYPRETRMWLEWDTLNADGEIIGTVRRAISSLPRLKIGGADGVVRYTTELDLAVIGRSPFYILSQSLASGLTKVYTFTVT